MLVKPNCAAMWRQLSPGGEEWNSAPEGRLTLSIQGLRVGSVAEKKNDHGEMALSGGPVDGSRGQLSTCHIGVCSLL